MALPRYILYRVTKYALYAVYSVSKQHPRTCSSRNVVGL
jgi:hypothetical protein